MERRATWRVSLYRLSILTITVLLLLCWASVAEAQHGVPPADEQYGNPAGAVGPAVGSAAPEAGSAPATAAGVSEASAAADSGGGVASVLPDTGGPLLYLLVLGGVALLGAGMLLMRKSLR